MNTLSKLASSGLAEVDGFWKFLTTSRWSERVREPGISDFVLGNPHDGVLPGFTQALAGALTPVPRTGMHTKLSSPNRRRSSPHRLAPKSGSRFNRTTSP
ncbi:MAG: hypothetical protein R2839_06760 [Thermomicrobiales bacterium]